MSWNIDASHTAIEFSVRHMMISKVRGSFDKFEGVVNLDEKNPANTIVDVTIDAASVNTRDPKRDAHLRSADFLSAEQYPTIHFKGTGVDVTTDTTAKLTGDLTISGQTHPVTVDVTHMGKSRSPWGTVAHGFEGEATISRKQWGLTWNVGLETGGVLVSDDIAVHIELELVEAPEKVAETDKQAVAAAA